MITTVTANPALDRTLHLTSLTPGAVHRAQDAMVEPSGKGVNVALALKTAGQEVTAVLPVGGSSGPELVAMLDAAGLIHRDVPIAGTVRSKILQSSDRLQRFMYSRSSFMHVSNEGSARAMTCQSPVMPGFTSSRR